MPTNLLPRNIIQLCRTLRKQRPYLDYLVDDRSLAKLLSKQGDSEMDFISPFGWGDSAMHNVEAKIAGQLLLQIQPDLLSGRIPVLVCPECADIECGAVTVRVERTGNLYQWSDFAFEGQTGVLPDTESFAHVQGFSFDRKNYNALFKPYSCVDAR